jgi:hypothetical protein
MRSGRRFHLPHLPATMGEGEVPVDHVLTGTLGILIVTGIMHASKHHSAGWLIKLTGRRKAIRGLVFAYCSGRLLVENPIGTARIIPRDFEVHLRLLDHIPSQQLVDCGGQFLT